MDRETKQALLTAADMQGLASEFLELLANAERYRWWRAQIQGVRALGSARPAHFGYPSTMALPPVRGDIMRGSVAEHFDHAVDAAMAAAPVLGAA